MGSGRVQCVWLASLVLFAGSMFAGQRGPNLPPVIEVFTSAKRPLINTDAKRAGSNLQGLEITVYEVDGIQSVERGLSLNLPVEPQQSKHPHRGSRRGRGDRCRGSDVSNRD